MRDAATGRILSIAAGSSVELPDSAAAERIEVILSDGVRSHHGERR